MGIRKGSRFLFVSASAVFLLILGQSFPLPAQTMGKGAGRPGQRMQAQDPKIVAELRKKEIAGLIKNLSSSNDGERRQTVTRIAKEYQEMVPEKITPLLKSKNSLERWSAVQIISDMPHERYKKDLLEVLKTDKDANVRHAVLVALLSYHTPDVGEALLGINEKAPAAEKVIIFENWEQNKFEPALPVLEKAVDDPSVEVRAAVIKALGAFRNEKYLDIFVRLFNDPNANIRYLVVSVLQKYPNIKQNKKIIAVLQRARKDPDHLVRRIAEKTMHFDRFH